MVDISDINDGESLEARLKDRPREDAVMIAHRAAMRVAPVYWEYVRARSGKGDLAELPILRSCLIAGVAGNLRTPEIFGAASASVDKASNTAAGTAAAFAALAAADVPTACDYAADAVDAAVASASASAVWAAVGADCTALEAAKIMIAQPLWHNAGNPSAETWRSIRQDWSDRGPDWRFWIDWYDDALAGRMLSEKLLTAVALIDPDDWDKGSEHVNGLIVGIVNDFDANNGKARPSSPTELPPELSQVEKRRIAERVQFNRDGLAFSIGGVLEQITAFRERVRGLNGLDPAHRQGLLDFLDSLFADLNELLGNIPSSEEEIGDEKANALAVCWQRFRPLVGEKARAYVSPENVSDAAVPAGIILGCIGIGALVSGPPGAAALAGGLITGQVKPNKALDEILKLPDGPPEEE